MWRAGESTSNSRNALAAPEFRYFLGIVPARARQIFVMLITIFLQTAPHVAHRLMATKGSIAHLTSSGLRALPART
jgi:hypothetical protein